MKEKKNNHSSYVMKIYYLIGSGMFIFKVPELMQALQGMNTGAITSIALLIVAFGIMVYFWPAVVIYRVIGV